MRNFSGYLVLTCAAMATLLVNVENAKASVIQLTFEGLQDLESINGFYNGGTGSLGSAGPNLGVAFSSNALAVIDTDAGGSGNFGGEPTPDTIMFFLDGNPFMDVAAGFTTGFSTYYSAIGFAGSLTIYDGLTGTGNILATLILPVTPSNGAPDPNGAFSPLVPIFVAFSGTAKSVVFGGVENQIGFDNVTFGSINPGPAVPEPSTLTLLSLGAVGIAISARRRRRSQQNAAV